MKGNLPNDPSRYENPNTVGIPLPQLKKHFNLLIENIKDQAVFITDVQGGILYWNITAKNITGYHATEITGRHLTTLFYEEESKPDVEKYLLKNIAGSCFEKEVLLSKKEDTACWSALFLMPLCNEDNLINGYAGIIHEIKGKTNQHQKTDYFNVIVNNIPEAIIYTDSAFIITGWNNAAAGIYGYSRDEATGKKINKMIMPFVEGETVSITDPETSIPVYLSGENEHLKKDGSAVTVSASWFSVKDLNVHLNGYVFICRDISLQKNAALNLERMHEKLEQQTSSKAAELKNIFERITDYFVALDQDFHYVYCNEKMANLLQRDCKSLTGKIIWEEYPWFKGTAFYDACYEAMQTQVYRHTKEYYPPINAWLDISIYPSADGLSLFKKDITEIKKAEEKIKREREFADAVINSLPGIFYLFNEDGTMHDWNKNLETVSGYSAKELTGMKIFELIGNNDKADVLQLIETLFTVGEASLYTQLTTRQGKKIPYYTIAKKMEYEGKICATASGFDDTERLMSEKLLMNEKALTESIMNSALDGIICMSDTGMVTMWNPSAEKIFGWKEEETKGKKFADIVIPPSSRHKYESGIKYFINPGEGNALYKVMQLSAVKRNGEELHIELSIIPIEQDGTNFFCAFIRNTTEKKKAEQEIILLNNELEKRIRERTNQLETANNDLEAFSYSVSHDLRAPLRTISGFSMMLKEDYEDKLDAEAIRLVDTVVATSGRMGQLIDDLLSFSKLGKNSILFKSVSMKHLVETCINELLTYEQQMAINLQVQEGLPDCYGDASMLKQVWINLLSNAIKYSSKKSAASVFIGFSEDNFTYTYYVKDEGVGFDMQYSHKLFGVFQRLHSNEEFEGTGVGLALVKRVLLKHKGSVWAESIPDRGTTFYFSIPKKN